MVWRRRSTNSKGKVNVALLHSNDETRKQMEEVVRGHSMLNLAGSARNLDTYDFVDPIESQENQIYLIEAVEGKTRDPNPEMGVIGHIKSRNKNANILLLTGKDTSREKLEFIASKRYLSSMNVQQDSSTVRARLQEYIKDCVDEGLLSQRLNIGVIGMGDIGSNIARQLLDKRWLGNLYWHTQNDKTLAFETLVHGVSYEEKVKRVQEMPQMMDPSLGLDLLIIARGKRRSDMEKAPPRGKVVWEDFPDTLRKIAPIYEQIEQQNFGGAILTFSNPPGVCQWVANNFYGINPYSLSSVACDEIRTRRFTRDMIVGAKPSLAKMIGIEDIEMQVWGEHGTGIVPYWEAATVNTENIADFLRGEEISLEADTFARIKDQVIRYSQENKKKAKESGINSFDVAMATASALASMARFQQIESESMLYSQLDKHALDALYGPSAISPVRNPFLIMPTRIEYDGQYTKMSSRIGFRRNAGSFDASAIKSLPQRVKAELQNVIEEQSNYLKVAADVLGKEFKAQAV